MRWRFKGDTCCACGGSTFNCCVGSITTHRDVNYIDSLIVRRQKPDLTWESREAVITPIELFATSLEEPDTGQVFLYPCAASSCKWDAPSGVVVEKGTGEYDQSFSFGQYDELLIGSWPWTFSSVNTTSLFGAFGLKLPLGTIIQECAPRHNAVFKANLPNDPDYWKKVEPPAMDAYLAQTTWDIQTESAGWDTWGSITFRFPHLTNFCWPSRGSTSGITYCNFANTTFTSGVYFDGSSGVNQSGTQSWFYDSVTQLQYLEIPFGGNTLQFRPSTVTGEDDILYMHINGGFFFAEKFSVSGTCDGNITWTSLNNPSHYVTFTLVNGETCNECGENTPAVTGCCTLADGTVDPNSNATACAALGGTYGGDDSVCPPTGCCTLPDTSVESDVTEAYCMAQSGSWVSGDCPAIPTGCCAIVGSPDQSGTTQAECTALGGTWTEGVDCAAAGYCQDPSTGVVTSGVEENDCTGTWSATPFPTGCCAITGGPDQPNKNQVECSVLGGTWTEGANCDGTGWCIDDTDGSVTSGVEQNDCTGTWSATQPTTGCCVVSGTNHEGVAQQWCTAQGGTFTAGACPPSTFNPCAETFAAAVNSVTLDMSDPSFECASPLNLNTPVWFQGGAFVDHDSCSTEGVKVIPVITTEVYGDNTAEPSSLSPVSNMTIKYISGSDTWKVTLTLQWTYNSNTYSITASKSNISNSGFNCPSFTLSGSFDTFTGNYTQLCSGVLKDVSDLVGSYNITLTCDTGTL